MIKAMISQPMRGKTEEQIRSERESLVTALLNQEDTIVVDSIIQSFDTVGNTPLWCLAKSLEIMSKCDVVYFMPGWENARGCRIEHECCKEYGIKTVYTSNGHEGLR